MKNLSKAWMKKSVNRYQTHLLGQAEDMLITLGLFLSEMVMHKKYGFGKERLTDFEKDFLALCKEEFVQGAEKWTEDRQNNVEQGIYNLGRAMDQLHGDTIRSEYIGKILRRVTDRRI